MQRKCNQPNSSSTPDGERPSFDWEEFSPSDSRETLWDVVIIGAGMGGSTLGHSLARRGLKVLFLERGTPPTRFPRSLQQGLLKKLFNSEPREVRLKSLGRWSRKITVMRGKQGFDFFVPLGSGPGGSSAIYGAALERMRRIDFSATEHAIGDGDPEPLRDEWPLDFDEFRQYYQRAEAMFKVAGTRDPDDPDDDSSLAAPPSLSERDQDFFDSFHSLGLKPYRVHVGISYLPGCRECLGVACPTDCKSDGSSRALRPALREHGAKILLNCTVERLEAEGERVTAVTARIGDEVLRLRGRVIVLAAGAMCTPILLRNSTSPEWPNGIGNQHDLVGRCLMFHASDFIALWPRKNLDTAGPRKTLSSRVFYSVKGRKLGSFQSLGVPISHDVVADFLSDWMERNLPMKIPFSRFFVKGLSLVSSFFYRRACVFATIMEDFPYLMNRVVPDPEKPSGYYIEYVKPRELSDRITTLRKTLKSTLAMHKPWLLTGDDNTNWGHPQGTCRFGTDPATSVLDPSNKVRGVENLYVVDASFFPSSGGTNPALTIAANALRVADIIWERRGSLRLDSILVRD